MMHRWRQRCGLVRPNDDAGGSGVLCYCFDAKAGWTITSASTGSTPSSDCRSVAVAAADLLRHVGSGPCLLWTMDFVSDQLANGRRIRVLNVLDDFSRRCLAAEVDTSLPGLRVCRVLERTLVYQPGRCPPYPRSMASGLQHRTTTQLTAKSHPGAVCPAATANRFITSKTSLGEWSISRAEGQNR
jgi:transposase InsO family protein